MRGQGRGCAFAVFAALLMSAFADWLRLAFHDAGGLMKRLETDVRGVILKGRLC